MKNLKINWAHVALCFAALFTPWTIALYYLLSPSENQPLGLMQIVGIIASIIIWLLASVGLTIIGRAFAASMTDRDQRRHLSVFSVLFAISIVGLVVLTVSGELFEALALVGLSLLLSGGLTFPMLALPLVPVVCLFVGFNYASKYELSNISGRVVYILSWVIILAITASVISALSR